VPATAGTLPTASRDWPLCHGLSRRAVDYAFGVKEPAPGIDAHQPKLLARGARRPSRHRAG